LSAAEEDTVRGRRYEHGKRLMIAATAGLVAAGMAACGGGSSGGSAQSTGPQTITVAVVNNPQMADIQKLTPEGFAASHPNIKVKYVTLDENTLRDQVTKDVAASGGQFDVVMIGPFEVPTWAQNKWISDITSQANSDAA
jgi:sorbitol/mannitol transport system substrate-binding protein